MFWAVLVCVHENILKVCEYNLQTACGNFYQICNLQLETKMNISHLEVRVS